MAKSKFKVGDIVIVTNLIKYGDGAYTRYLFKKGTVVSITGWRSHSISVRFTETTCGHFFKEELLLVTKKTNLKMVKLLYVK